MLTLATIQETQRQSLELAGLPDGWLRLLGLLLLLALGYAVIWMYRREARGGAGARLRAFLSVLRCLALLLLAAIWLQPVIATYNVRTIHAQVVVLADASASMAIRSAEAAGADGGLTRVGQVSQLLAARNYDWLRKLAAKNELNVYAFGEQAARLPLPADLAPPKGAVRKDAPAEDAKKTGNPPLSPATGGSAETSFMARYAQLAVQNRTDLGQAVAKALEDAGDAPIAGVIVLSDGGLNKGMSAAEITAYVQRYKTRLYGIGVGEPREPPNIRVTNVAAPTTTPKGDPFEIRVETAAAGIEPTPMQLELTARRTDASGAAGSGERTVATRTITLGGDKPAAEARFSINPEAGGEYIYRAKLTPLPGEVVLTDNARDASVQVLDEQIRVLMVAGRPSYDYRFVERLLERDKTINVSCWLQSADARAVRDGDTVVVELPRKAEDIFNYDVILLMDPNPTELDSSWAIAVRRFVDEFGGGLLLQAGSHFTTRFLNDARLTDLIGILPIVPDPDAEVRLSEEGTYRARAYAPQLPDETRGHALLLFEPDDAANRAVWNNLAGVGWYLPVLREKPLATVLLRHSGPTRGSRYGAPVLLAVQPVGAGRAAFLGFDGTWRWRGTGERYFNHFWVQLVRYLSQARRQAASKRGTIALDREAVNVGDYVKIEARVLDEAFVPWHQPQIEAILELSDGARRPVVLTAIPEREGWFTGRALLDQEGTVVLRMPLLGAANLTRPASQRAADSLVKIIHVQRPDIELRTLRLQAEPLMAMAEQTGGRYVPLSEAAALPEWIEKAGRTETTRGPNRQLWDRTWVLLLLAGLLTVEWTLRRRNHLL